MMVRLNQRSMQGGMVSLSEVRDLRWRRVGKVARLFARVWCNLMQAGAVHHDCEGGPHDTLVRIVKADNPELFEQVAAAARVSGRSNSSSRVPTIGTVVS